MYMKKLLLQTHFFITVSYNFPRWPGNGYSLGVTICSATSESCLRLTFSSLTNPHETRAGDQDPYTSERLLHGKF